MQEEPLGWEGISREALVQGMGERDGRREGQEKQGHHFQF